VWYRSIGFKLIASVGAVAILAIGIISYANLKSQREQLLQEMLRNVHMTSEVIRRSLRSDMLEYQPHRLHKAIDTIGAQEGIEKVRIFNALGGIIYSSDKGEMGTMLDKSAEQCYACHAREKPFERLATSARTRTFRSSRGYRVLGMINPIYNEPDCYSAVCHEHPKDQKVLGVLDIDVGLGEIDRLLQEGEREMILFAVLATCGISGIIALLIDRLINRPVTRLVDGMKRVAAGDLEAPIQIRSRDEIGALADSFNDMTLRLKASEQELRTSEEKYRSLFENDPNPIFVLDVDSFSILEVNIRAAETYGYSREELLGMSFLGLGEPVDAERLQSLAAKSCIFLPKVRHHRKDGSPLYVNVHSCPRLHIGRDVIIANIADITHRIQVEAQLIQAGKMATLGEMSAGMAHELNQPLNAIRIGCEYFLKMISRGQHVPEDTLARVSGELVGQVERASSIINHLREFGRKSESEAMGPVNIEEPIRGVFTVLGQQLKLREIDVRLDLGQDLPPIQGVCNRLEQVFLNLVMNAWDAIEEKRQRSGGMPTESRLTVCTYREGDHVCATFSDTGTGIPEAIGDRIFEPFFTTKEVGKGTGLGLSISYGIVKDFGGDIKARSEEGVGTTFILRFPVARHEALWSRVPPA
jgi:PAS domain S-box-containing protein